MIRKLTQLALLWSSVVIHALAGDIAIHAGKLVDVAQGKVLEQQTIRISDGVNIAFGTDAGVGPHGHGSNAKEFRYMVETGYPVMAALQSATVNAAKLLRQQDVLGQIAPGYYADIVAVRDDPFEDVTALESVDFVMTAGEVVVQR